MTFTRNLKRFMRGDDVLEVKKQLVSLGYLAGASHNMYGNDTYKAVKSFQAANNLEADGIVGRLTWAALFGDVFPVPSVNIPDHIANDKAVKIAADLSYASKERQNICLNLLEFAVDPDLHGNAMRCFYVRGGNLYNADLSENTMTLSKLNKYFSKSAYAPYYDGGRREMMLAMAKDSGFLIPGADCSGTVVGVLRRNKITKPSFDANANSLYKSYCVETKTPKPGDFAWKSGHIGVYVGGGYVVENIGGAYGCQLTAINKRKCWSYNDKKYHTMSKWTSFGDPKFY